MYGTYVVLLPFHVTPHAALERAKLVTKQADVVAALTLEALNGSVKAYDPGELPMCTVYSLEQISG